MSFEGAPTHRPRYTARNLTTAAYSRTLSGFTAPKSPWSAAFHVADPRSTWLPMRLLSILMLARRLFSAARRLQTEEDDARAVNVQ